jgi:ADP-ribosylglycohydrolase
MEWFKTKPFDIGNTTYNAVSSNSYEEMVENSRLKNANSKANGALMRITPLITKAVNMNSKPFEVIEACFKDAQLTHSSITC